MGTWTIYEVGAESLAKTDPFNYAIAQAAAAADVIAASSGDMGESNAGGFPIAVLRAFTRFDTFCIAGLTPTAAVINGAFYGAGFAPPLGKDITVNVVKGSGISDPLVLADYGYLLGQVVPYASVLVAWGDAGTVWVPMALSPAGLADVNPGGWTKYGWRTSDDIVVLAPVPADKVWAAAINSFPGFLTQVCVTNNATVAPGTLNLSGKLTETTITTKSTPKLVITVAEAINGSNIDVQFRYTGPANGATPWVNSQVFETVFTASVGGLPPGVYNYQLWARGKRLATGEAPPFQYSYFAGALKNIIVPAPVPTISVGNAIKKKLFTTGMI